MKKTLTTIAFLLVFTFFANAQDKSMMQSRTAATQEAPVSEAAKKDAYAITEYLGLNDTQRADFTRLFEAKHKVMQDPSVSAEKKKEMSRIIGLKIEASLDAKQLEKLKENKMLCQQLTSENVLEAKKN